MRKYKGEIGLLVVAMIWGSGFIGSVIGLGYMTPYEALTGRFLVASLLLNIIFFRRILKLSRKTLMRGFIIGFFLYVAFLLQTLGLELTTPSKNAFLTAVNVVVVPLLGFLILKNRLNRKDIAGAILALAGVGIISLDPTGAINLGDLLSFLCAIAFAYHIFYTGQYSSEDSAIDLTLVQMNTAFLFSMAVMLVRGETLLGTAGGGYAAILYLGVFSTTLAFFMQTFSQKSTTNTRAAI
ncbi:MAG TPA: DMT family transporter, partial [Clostridiaceae bacterium]|nr:DMT family transporter [Clostridiaceae bacterium]